MVNLIFFIKVHHPLNDHADILKQRKKHAMNNTSEKGICYIPLALRVDYTDLYTTFNHNFDLNVKESS